MADETIIISNLPTHTPAGTDYLAIEDSSVTGKATVNDVVAAATQVQTNASNIATNASAIAQLNSNINGFALTRTSVGASATKTITPSESSSYLIITTGASAANEHTLTTVIQTTSTATPIVRSMVSGSAVTVTGSGAKTLTIENSSSSHTVYIAILTLRGSAPTVN